MRIAALLCALSWVAVRAMLVCGCPASKGGILRAISPAGRRFRASALVSGRKNHDVYTFLCIHVHLFLVFAFRDARFLSGLYGRFSYIVLELWVPHLPYVRIARRMNDLAALHSCLVFLVRSGDLCA